MITIFFSATGQWALWTCGILLVSGRDMRLLLFTSSMVFQQGGAPHRFHPENFPNCSFDMIFGDRLPSKSASPQKYPSTLRENNGQNQSQCRPKWRLLHNDNVLPKRLEALGSFHCKESSVDKAKDLKGEIDGEIKEILEGMKKDEPSMTVIVMFGRYN